MAGEQLKALQAIYDEASQHPLYLGDNATDAEINEAGGDAATITFVGREAFNALYTRPAGAAPGEAVAWRVRYDHPEAKTLYFDDEPVTNGVGYIEPLYTTPPNTRDGG